VHHAGEYERPDATAKRGVVTGLVASAASGLPYLLFLGFADSPISSIALLGVMYLPRRRKLKSSPSVLGR